MHEMCGVKATRGLPLSRGSEPLVWFKNDSVLPGVEIILEENFILLVLIKFVNLNK